jgi:DNA-binding transcriptional MerR regulator
MAEGGSELTIDQLAQQTGMSARNIRAHQSRGLLAPPTLRGRTGYYGPDHVARIKVIERLQEDGFSLSLIERLLRVAGGSTDTLLRFADEVHEPFGQERPRTVEIDVLQRRFRSSSGLLFERLVALGMLRSLGDGRVEEVTPQAFEVGEIFADLGLPAEELVDVVAEVRKHVDAIATTFLRLFVERVWRPFEQAGQPEEGLDHVLDTLQRIRPLASTTVLSLFQMAMGDVAERRFGLELSRLELQRRG